LDNGNGSNITKRTVCYRNRSNRMALKVNRKNKLKDANYTSIPKIPAQNS
jgi:hypothetical protein